jgi:hypothetical protein
MKADNLHLVGTDVNLGRVLKKKKEEIIKHICFAKAMWKARCAAIWSEKTISPFRIVDLYRDIRKRTKKLKCDTNAQPIVSADDLAEFNINNNSLV